MRSSSLSALISELQPCDYFFFRTFEITAYYAYNEYEANGPGFPEPARLTATACTTFSFEHATWTLVFLSIVRAQMTAEDFHSTS